MIIKYHISYLMFLCYVTATAGGFARSSVLKLFVFQPKSSRESEEEYSSTVVMEYIGQY